MRADYLGPWMELLLARLEPGERLLARGRAFEPHGDSFELSQLISGPGCAVVVTQRRALWVSSGDQRWLRTLPFAVVRSYVELTQAHRYALALDHEGVERLQWAPAHRFLGWSWGNTEALRPVRGSVLGFSRRDTAAAHAIRVQLQAGGIPVGEPRSLPKRERRHEVPDSPMHPDEASVGHARVRVLQLDPSRAIVAATAWAGRWNTTIHGSNSGARTHDQAHDLVRGSGAFLNLRACPDPAGTPAAPASVRCMNG
jgi:hypothetical protein